MTDTDTMWNALPAVVTTYLTAHKSRDVAAALSTFTADAAVTDEGHTVRGRDAIGAWLNNAGSEYTFTTTFTGATVSDPRHVDVAQRLKGDFPGGVADLHYRFTLAGEHISGLVIEP
jgi:ketosteroid isomerase-like protein